MDFHNKQKVEVYISIKKRRLMIMRKVIVLITAILLLIAISGCRKIQGTEIESAKENSKSDLSYDERYNDSTFDGISALGGVQADYWGRYEEWFVRKYLDNPNALFVKVTATYDYNCIVNYALQTYGSTTKEEYKERYGVDVTETDEYGNLMVNEIDIHNSFMLTDVKVDKIYFKGDKVKIKIGDIIPVKERHFIFERYIKEQPEVKKGYLNYISDVKIFPEKEYIILLEMSNEEETKQAEKNYFKKDDLGMRAISPKSGQVESYLYEKNIEIYKKLDEITDKEAAIKVFSRSVSAEKEITETLEYCRTFEYSGTIEDINTLETFRASFAGFSVTLKKDGFDDLAEKAAAAAKEVEEKMNSIR